MKGHRHCKDAGFTTVELIVTIAIISIVAGIAIPTFRVWLPNYRLRSAAQDIFSNLQLTKIEAIRQNQNNTINFNIGGNTYQPTGGRPQVDLKSYDNSIQFGGPNAGDVSGTFFIFSPRGLVTSDGVSNWVYLRNVDRFYRVGAQASGIIQIQRYDGAWPP